MNYLYRCYASNNPACIEINLGWYALCECICTKHHSSEVLARWCGLQDVSKPRKPYTWRVFVPPNAEDRQKVLDIYRENPKLKNIEIAKMVGRSNTFVSRILLAMGIKRGRWDEYISKDKRYSKEKRECKNEHL